MPVQPTVIHERMEYGIVRIINLHIRTQEELLEDSKPRRGKDSKTEDSIRELANQTQTLLQYTVYALSNTRMEILIFFGN